MACLRPSWYSCWGIFVCLLGTERGTEGKEGWEEASSSSGRLWGGKWHVSLLAARKCEAKVLALTLFTQVFPSVTLPGQKVCLSISAAPSTPPHTHTLPLFSLRIQLFRRFQITKEFFCIPHTVQRRSHSIFARLLPVRIQTFQFYLSWTCVHTCMLKDDLFTLLRLEKKVNKSSIRPRFRG